MRVRVEVEIQAPPKQVWDVVTDIANSAERIQGIEEVEVLEKPKRGLVGLKWRETRTLFGKTATEVMWVTEAEKGSHYDVRAESHGMVYTTRVALDERPTGTLLSMEMSGTAQTLGTKVLGALMAPMFKGATRKALQKDLDDIKAAVEAHR